MNKLILPLSVLTACYVLLFGYATFSYGSLPSLVAAHFDIYGRPNGWMPRGGVVTFTLFLGILLPGLMISIMVFAGKLPVKLVNLPNRDYWLAPERRGKTNAILLRFSLWLASMTVLFVTYLHRLIVEANMVGGSQINSVGIAVVTGLFLLGTMGWSIVLIRRFMRTDEP